MAHHKILASLLQQPALLILLGAFIVLMALMIPAYFYVYRPKPDSTEWIGRLDRRSFQPLTAGALNLTDIVWALIAMACAAFIWLVYCILRRNVMLMMDPFAFILRHLRNTLPIALAAVSLYLLQRLMSARPLPAILASVVGAISILSAPQAIALFSLSLLFLYLWICEPYDAPLFFRKALWFILSAAAFGLALTYSSQLLWTVPFYLGVYIAMQVIRWKHDGSGKRAKRLALSIVLTVLLLFAGVLAVCLVYCVRHDKGSPFYLIRSFSFYKGLIPGLLRKLSRLTRRSSYWDILFFRDSFLFLTGLIALVPLLHGVIKLRDTRCLFMLLLLPCLLLMWYFSACYALIPAFALIIGWCWNFYARRGRPLFAVGFAATYLVFFFAELYIH